MENLPLVEDDVDNRFLVSGTAELTVLDLTRVGVTNDEALAVDSSESLEVLLVEGFLLDNVNSLVVLVLLLTEEVKVLVMALDGVIILLLDDEAALPTWFLLDEPGRKVDFVAGLSGLNDGWLFEGVGLTGKEGSPILVLLFTTTFWF